MAVALRPHHLLCMLTYVGKGYSDAFCANYDGIIARLASGEAIRLVEGPDDICAPVLESAGSHCRNESVTERDAAALAAAVGLLGMPLASGSEFRLDADRLASFRAAFRSGSSRAACGGCEWTALCDSVAAAGFPGARLAL